MNNSVQADDLPQDVHILVRDKPLHRTQNFVVPLLLLQNGMRYFQPILKKALKDRSKDGDDSSKKKKGPITLNVNCNIEIFRWLVAYLQKENPKLTNSNAVSVILSSHFLRMDELTDVALLYFRDHLADILVSGVDMECIQGELLGRFCTITKESHVAATLLSLYEWGKEDHVGRSLLVLVARHLAILRLNGNTISHQRCRFAENVSGGCSPPSSTKKESAQSSTTASSSFHPDIVADKTAEGKENDDFALLGMSVPSDNGLRWCRLCGILYDSASIQRLLKLGKCIKPVCDALMNQYELCMGPRGEVFTSHVASDNPVCISPPSTWNQQEIEHWSWQVIGSILLVVCNICRCPCSLNEALYHSCPGVKFVSEDPGFEDGELQTILRWMQLCVAKQAQRGERNFLVPLRQIAGIAHSPPVLSIDRIVLPRYTAKMRVNSSVPMITTITSVADEANEEAGAVVDLPWACTWEGQRHKAREVALGYEGGIDVDLLNFFERQMMRQLYHCRAEAAASQPGVRARFRLSVTPQNSQPLSFVPFLAEKLDRTQKGQKRLQKMCSSPSPISHSSLPSSKDSTAIGSSQLRMKSSTGRGENSGKERNFSKSASRGFR